MGDKIFFLPVKKKEDPLSLAKRVKELFDKSGASETFNKNDFIGVKTHFGERGNTTYVHPLLVKAIIDKLIQYGTKPFLTETSTLYRGQRANAMDHISIANEHGFGFEKMRVPIIMADGLWGDSETGIEVNGKHFRTVNIASEIAKVQGLVVISHLTGHSNAGFGCTIKNIGMGLASRRGKLKQHSVMSPEISPHRCTACGMCIQWCPKDTISIVDGKAFIHKENCIGCGECLAVCKYGAVLFDWRRESRALQEMMAEHAAGVIKAVRGKIYYFNFLINITKDCDCGHGGRTVSQDIGILAGRDIVAIEKASYDLFLKVNGKPLRELTYPHIDPLIQIQHAEYLGLGSSEYQLVEVK